MQQVQEKKMYRRRQSQVCGPHGNQGNQKEKGRKSRRRLQMIIHPI